MCVFVRIWLQVNEFHGRYQYLFIESICTDEDVLEQNYRYVHEYVRYYYMCSTLLHMQYTDSSLCVMRAGTR